MRNVQLNEPFDAVVNLFTSFGYFDSEEENGRVIQQIDRLLKPGGKFIIDFLNAAFVQERLVPESHRVEDGLDIYESRRIENGFVKKKIRIVEAGSEEREYEEQVKLYGLPQMESFIRETGLRIDAVYGSYEATPYEEQSSPRLIIVGHKA
jgi:SAM-dependent methyltransferase